MYKFDSSLYEQTNAWALIPFPNGLTTNVVRTETQTVSQLRSAANAEEKNWGNTMIGQESNGNWTTRVGEDLVHDTLLRMGKNPRRPARIGGYEPDWETDDAIYEVKTRNWTTSGTAGEKVLGVMFKYSDIPELYGKPLRIVCVAYQEWELTHGTTRIFGDVSKNKRKMLDLAAGMNIEYVKYSDLVSKIQNTN